VREDKYLTRGGFVLPFQGLLTEEANDRAISLPLLKRIKCASVVLLTRLSSYVAE
jgi:hypothetical protein